MTAAQEALWYAVYAGVAAVLDGRLQPRSRTRRCTGSQLGDRLLSPQRSLYGSLTGAAYNQQLFGFTPQDHPLDLLLSPTYALRLYDGLWVWTRFNLPRVTTLPALVAVPRVVGGLALAGLAMAAADRLRARRSADRQPAAVVAWTLALAWPVGVYAMVAAYDGHGGHTHPRYLFPGLATLAAVGALGLDRLAGARHGLWVVGVALAQLALTGAAWAGSSSSSVGLRMAWRRPGNPARPAPPSHRRSPSLVASCGTRRCR